MKLAKTVYMTDKNSIRPYSLRYRDCLLYVYDMTQKIGKDRIVYFLEDRIVYALVIHIVYAHENRIVDALENRIVYALEDCTVCTPEIVYYLFMT